MDSLVITHILEDFQLQVIQMEIRLLVYKQQLEKYHQILSLFSLDKVVEEELVLILPQLLGLVEPLRLILFLLVQVMSIQD